LNFFHSYSHPLLSILEIKGDETFIHEAVRNELSPKLELLIAQSVKSKSYRAELPFWSLLEELTPEFNFIKLASRKIRRIDFYFRQAGYQSEAAFNLFWLLAAFFQFIQKPTALSLKKPELQAITAGVNSQGNFKLNACF